MRYNILVPSAAILTFAALVACGRDPAPAESATTEVPAATPSPAEGPLPPADPAPTGATAQLAPTQGNTASGTLTVTAEGAGVRLSGALQGLAPNGEFGFHIHEKGDCSAPDASSAGEHFNPAGAQHGNPEGASQGGTHHAGDIPNAKSDAQGAAQVDAVATGVTLGDGGPNDVRGKAVVLHEKADDYKTQPSGNSGKRIACGVIG
jgi:superoxide dismutase, Cu-Zn family